jgi:hypothetical protein
MTRIVVKEGREGPKHDPYHYEEVTITRLNGTETVYHCGALAQWIKVRSSDRAVLASADTEADCLELFEQYVGVSYKVAVRAHASLPWRRLKAHPCGLTFIVDVNGYPGETLQVCGKCGHVVDSHMDMSAIV